MSILYVHKCVIIYLKKKKKAGPSQVELSCVLFESNTVRTRPLVATARPQQDVFLAFFFLGRFCFWEVTGAGWKINL